MNQIQVRQALVLGEEGEAFLIIVQTEGLITVLTVVLLLIIVPIVLGGVPTIV